MLSTPLLLAFHALALSATAAEPSLEDWNVSRQEWTHEISEGSDVAIVNLHGDLRVRDGARGEVYVLANIQHHNDDPRRARVATANREGEFHLEVLWSPTTDTDPAPADVPEAWNRRRVDLTIFVPPNAGVKARTDDGLVELRGLTGEIEAASVRGDVRVRAAGALQAYTRHGEVLAQFRRTDWSTASEIETLTGEIRVELPRGGRAGVRLETRGEITTDYSIEIHRQDGSLLKRGSARIGKGGGQLTLRSNRGAIRLIESTVPEQETPTDREQHPASDPGAKPDAGSHQSPTRESAKE